MSETKAINKPEVRPAVSGAAAGWITAAIAIAGILISTGGIYTRVCQSADADIRQDSAIYALQNDMAVIKATTSRTQNDIEKLDSKMDTLLRRPWKAEGP